MTLSRRDSTAAQIIKETERSDNNGPPQGVTEEEEEHEEAPNTAQASESTAG